MSTNYAPSTRIRPPEISTKNLSSTPLKYRPAVVWFTGLSGAGKTTSAEALRQCLQDRGCACYLLDGDALRAGLCRDLGYSAEDRQENIRRAGEVCRLLMDAGFIVLATFISPSRADRQAVRDTRESRSGLSAVVGKWPGGESEEEILAILEDIS